MSRLSGLIGGELKPRGLDRPMIGGVLERSQPIAALDLRARKLLARLVRAQCRLARFAAGCDRAFDERLQHRVQRRPPLLRIGRQSRLRDHLRHRAIRLAPPIRVGRLEPERLGDEFDLTRDLDQDADPSIVLPNGLPIQVHPTFSEPGLPAFSFPAGGSSSVGGSSSSGGDSGSGSSGTTGGSGDAYNLMMAQDWGSQAASAAAAMGVSATALAATCEMESNCQNVGSTTSVSNASGAFQMINSTYTADINGALAYDPGIASSIVSGLAGKM